MANKTHDLAVKVGEYTDPLTGQPKGRYINVGALFTRDDGSLAIKLESVPVGVQWTGWVSAFPARPKTATPPQQQAPHASIRQPASSGSMPDDDIPF